MKNNFKTYIDSSHNYIEKSRSPLYSFLMVIPLLLLYEFLIIETGSTVRNGADVLTKFIFSFAGINGMIGFSVILFGAFSYVIYRDTVQGNKHVSTLYFFFMTIESIIYAFILGPLVAKLTSELLYSKLSTISGISIKEQLVVSLGAGIYEEFVFRFLLVSFFIYIFTKIKGFPKYASVGFAVIWASLFFSGFHYIGAYSYTFHISTFMFRFLAGIVLSLLYYFRGFGVVVYVHTFYDILISLGMIH